MLEYITLYLILITILLTACGEKEIEVLKENTYTIENVSFKYAEFLSHRKMIIDTNQESVVVELRDSRFIKTEEPQTTVLVKWIKDPNIDREYMDATLYISEKDIKELSRKYTKQYETTMEFEEIAEK